MIGPAITLAIAVAGVTVQTSAPVPPAAACLAAGEQGVGALHRRWILEGGDGVVTAIRIRSDLVWRCGAGEWRIVREHNSTRVVPAAEVSALLSSR